MKTTYHKWCKINRNTLKIAYSIFLDIFNDKYNLQLIKNEFLYSDFCKYMYESGVDKYGNMLFNNRDEYIKFCKENKMEESDSENDDYSIYDDEEDF